ncbi:MAG: T9SS type A sorting domain-containing protein [Candidatus Krumholzibacteria bacterium]|nr:T9SS type A sorting domain-containing protein [Candidatus Krumholzibacteria bacterium]MDH4336118.1 T9SS type A sorting domain-containing protein [Candidatus Krumholzibacteria bacterium]
MRSSPRHYTVSWIVLITTCAALAVFAPGAFTDDSTPITGAPRGWTRPAPEASSPPDFPALETSAFEAAAPDEARWINGELLAPLPTDPDLRRQALQQAAANAAATPSAPGVVHTTGAQGGSDVSLSGGRSTDDNIPHVEPYIPAEVRNGKKTWNLKLPDQFVADPQLMLGVDPESGKALNQNEQDRAITTSFAPALQHQFEGIGQTNLTPPDCDLSVGPSHVMAVVNARFAIYDKCGNNLYENNIATFVGNGTDFFFDPKVVYDIWDGRWYITCLVRNNSTLASWVILLYSDDSNPIGAWNWHYLDFRLNGGTSTNFWADYQDVGTDPNSIYISANMFNWSSPPAFQYAKLRCLDKADVLDGGGVCWWDYWSLTNPGDGSLAFSLRTSEMISYPSAYWLVNSVSYGASFMTVWKVTGATVCTGPTLTSYNMPTAAYDDPPAALQPNGTYVDCGDARLQNSVYYNSNVWAGHARRVNWSEPTDRSAVAVCQFNPNTLAVNFYVGFGAAGLYYAYPAVNFDTALNGIVAFSRAGPTENPGSRYADLANGGPWGSSALLISGNTSYTGSSDAGTLADPYRWGDYYGAALDPINYRAIWMYGEYTVNAFNWGTRVGVVSPQGPGVLSVTPSPGLVSGGLAGGPFSPSGINYTVSNTGNAPLTWSLSGVNTWNSASSTGGQLGAGGSTIVSINIDASANAFGPGIYTDAYTFADCYSGAALGRSTVLHVGADGSCDGSQLALTPGIAPPNYGADGATYERGVYITAIKDFRLCAMAYKLELSSLPRTLTARIYAANGVTRGALLATGSIAITQQGNVLHHVPISYTLQSCQDYELVFEIAGGDAWEWWSEGGITEPFDVGGAIRVRDGSLNGGAGNTALPHIEITGIAAPNPAMLSDLGGPGAPPNSAPDDNNERGIFIKALDTAQLCAFGWEADLPAGSQLTARVYRATGTVRGALVAEGTYTVPSSGLQFHDIPINYQLEEGRDYDLAVEFGVTNSWPWWDENTFAEPYDVDVFRVVDAEAFGSAINYALPHYRASWEEKTGGSPFDLRKITDVLPPPNSANQPNSEYGAFVTSNISQQVYSIGWMADVPAGQPIIANVYDATGIVRGALLSTGTVISSGPGMRWHDIPLAAPLVAGQDYDIAIQWATINELRWWSDTSGLPYTINGVITVRDGESQVYGGAGNTALIHMRMHACDENATPVLDGPQKTPFFMAAPAPNPIATSARLNFSLEEDGPVTITVYDVAGRRVQTLIDGQHTPRGWHSIDLNSSGYASGVYFLKMQSNAKSLSRKFVVVH